MKIEETTDKMTIVSRSPIHAIVLGVVAIIFAVLAAFSVLFLGILSGCLSLLIFGAFAITFARLAISSGETIEVTLDRKSGKVIWQRKPWL
jgi:hypothetical protein